MKKTNIGMPFRSEILAASLVIEKMTSAFLSVLLGIKDLKNSRVLGNRSGCLSFNQKIDLLIEMGAVSSKDRNKFQAFMEIRNQFMHNISANTYENCYSFMNGTDKFILKTYPQDNTKAREEALREATGELIDEIGKITVNIISVLKGKFKLD